MKKHLTTSKQLARLWAATAHAETCGGVEPSYSFVPARKPLSGRAARRLIGTHYNTLDAYEGGWLFVERPRFRKGERYIILAEREDGQPETLRVCRAADNRA